MNGPARPSSTESTATGGPWDHDKTKTSRVRLWGFAIVVLLAAVWLLQLVVVGIPQTYEDNPMHFKYGSIGSDNLRRGIPYEIWRVLPDMFSEYLYDNTPGNASPVTTQQNCSKPQSKSNAQSKQNYEAFGLITDQKDGEDRPIGFSKRWHLGVGDVIGLNCAFCHVSTIRKSAAHGTGPNQARPHHDDVKIVLGMPANTVDAEAFFRFLFTIADDPRFTVEDLLTCIQQKRRAEHERLGYWETFIQRRLVIPTFIRGLKDLKQTFSFLERRPTPFGPGRVDTWAAYKVLKLQDSVWFMEYFPARGRSHIDLDAGPVTGLADFPALWPVKVPGGGLHWDGNTPTLQERNYTAALGAGVTPATLDVESLKRIARWMTFDLTPLPYHDVFPSNGPVQDTSFGRMLFKKHCYDCHDAHGARIKELIPVAACALSGDTPCDEGPPYIGTDPERLRAFTHALSEKLNTVRHLSRWSFNDYRKTYGYANMLLTGIWLRAPYLHNGSVPTLWHLLQRPEERPVTFCRGNDVYDWDDVGFEWEVQEPGENTNPCHPFHHFDTTKPGNGNGGHLYGTDIPDHEKRALIEYLKTL